MNPYEYILSNVYGNDMRGMDAGAVLVLRIMADNYKGDMPAGGTCCDVYKWCLAQLSKYKPNELIDWIDATGAQVAPHLYD